MNNACAEEVTQDQGPAGVWELSREAVKEVSSDSVTRVANQIATNRPVWEIQTTPYAKVQIIRFF